jgi:hypothetical protein
MHVQTKNQVHSDALPLRNAVLCVDCEFVSTCQFTCCPVCGSRSIFSIAPMLGGCILPPEDICSVRDGNVIRFNLEIDIDLQQMEAKDVTAVVEGIADVIRLKLGRKASFHINVEPVADTCGQYDQRAA